MQIETRVSYRDGAREGITLPRNGMPERKLRAEFGLEVGVVRQTAWMISLLFLIPSLAGAQTPPPAPGGPAAVKPGSGDAQKEAPATTQPAVPPSTTPADQPAEPVSDAERIVRLQRTIDDARKQLEGLRTKADAPTSEFAKAEADFSEIDGQYTQQKELVASLTAEGQAEQLTEAEKTLQELEAKRGLAKERFDLAIQERKTLREQISTLETRISQDSAALRKLKGETEPVTSQPANDQPSPVPSAAESSAAPTPPPPPTSQPVPTSEGPAAVAPPPADSDKPPAAKPSAELIKAKDEAVQKQAAAQEAHQEVQSVGERLAALQKNIELELELLATARRRADNAQAAERALEEKLDLRWQEGAPAAELQDLRRQIAEARQRVYKATAETQEHSSRLDQLRTELSNIQAEKIQALEKAETKQREAEVAKKKVKALENPFSPHNLLQWLIDHGPRLVGIIVGVIALLWLSRLVEARVVSLMIRRGDRGTVDEQENRAKTLVGVFHNGIRVVVIPTGILMILAELGMNIMPLIGGAAVAGLAVAFGAQALIRDYFTGFVILLENQYALHDVIKIGGVSGVVERVTLRMTVLRDLEGVVHFIPNGQINTVSNMTHGWSRALFDIGVAYKEDVDRVMQVLMDVGRGLREDDRFRFVILEDPEMLGVDAFGDSAVTIKFFIKTRPLTQWRVKREMLRRIKRRFDELGIEIPFPHRTVYHRHETPPDPAGETGIHPPGDVGSDEGAPGSGNA